MYRHEFPSFHAPILSSTVHLKCDSVESKITYQNKQKLMLEMHESLLSRFCAYNSKERKR